MLRTICIVAILGAFSSLSASQEFEELVAPFFESHCIKCHGEKKQKGDVRLDHLETDFLRPEIAVAWQDISDMLIIGDMPPEEEERPDSSELSGIIDAIDTHLRKAAEQQGHNGRI
ncbi:MAG: c-type cytochrome domain-containing protein, partial [Opitutales bacterium]